jgi:hypothetical protein
MIISHGWSKETRRQFVEISLLDDYMRLSSP